MLALAVAAADPAAAQSDNVGNAVGDPVHEHPAPSPEPENESGVHVEADGTIVVTVGPPRGSVIGNVPPEEIFDADDLRALGVTDVGGLVDLLRPQLGGSPGDETVVLLNGRRIASFASIRIYPREALERVEVLPPHVAQAYGYPAGGRVINIVLLESYRGGSGEVATVFATEGGRSGQEAKATMLEIAGENRLSFGAEVSREDSLFESERGIVQPVPELPFDLIGNVTAVAPRLEVDPGLSAIAGRPVSIAGVPLAAVNGAASLADFASLADAPNLTDTGRFRTLLPATERVQLSAEIARLIGDIAATLTARYVGSTSEARLGLAGARLLVPADNPFSPFGNDIFLYRYLEPAHPFGRRSTSHAAHLGVNLAGELAGWHWNYIATLDHSRNSVRIDTGISIERAQDQIAAADSALNPFGALNDDLAGEISRDSSRTLSTRFSNRLRAIGTLLRLPAGPVRTIVQAAHDLRVTETSTVRAGNVLEMETTRRLLRGSANLHIPITSRRNNFAAFAGDLSLRLDAAVEDQTRSPMHLSFGYGVNWRPFERVGFDALVEQSEQPLDDNQLTDPLVEIPNVRVFDFRSGETVEAVQIVGGNPELLAPQVRNMNLRVYAQPMREPSLTLVANYASVRIRNLPGNLTAPIPEIEAAFPEQFVRDASGRLVRFDSRPLNFAGSETERIGALISLNIPLASGRRPPVPSARPTAPVAGRAIARPSGPAGVPMLPPANAPMTSRIYATLNYQHALSSTILFREGFPRINLFESAYAGGEGRSRHSLNLSAGLFHNGWQARFESIWTSGRTVRSGQSTLAFSDLAILNLQTSLDFGARPEWIRRTPFFEGLSVRAEIRNLLNSRQRVRDEGGETPLAYQTAYLDPLGRSVRLTLRKAF